MATFTEDWIGWIDENVSTGCDKNGIFKILLDESNLYIYNIFGNYKMQPFDHEKSDRLILICKKIK